MMNDYSIVFEESEITTEKARLNVKGRFLRENFEANKQFTSTERIRSLLTSGV
jgi:hypothetical protein